ncbi:MAG: hypothetical protein ACYDB3_11775, partial [Acidimicrobiales bacterium]
AFGHFWWEFLVGDTPELLVGSVVVIGITALLADGLSLHPVAVVSFPVLVGALLAGSAYRGRHHR